MLLAIAIARRCSRQSHLFWSDEAVVKLLGEILASPAVDAPRHRHRQRCSRQSHLFWSDEGCCGVARLEAIWLNVLTLVINFSAMMMEVPDLLIDGVASPLVHLIS
ncbi:hypothetical protein Bca52824_046366 [Brassica carinata]|uniref:Uncharacterized protein n=1 Tax=Brassica carinata TaxID=52824 RepID=A0A8X7REX8_BRACI|nr:hypothetical protein Bca52824_046366 [Brassica carinata]